MGVRLVVGMFMAGGAAIIILAPVLSQVATSVGIHPLHFGFVMVLNIVIGLLTPPLGACLFLVCSLSRIPIGDNCRNFMDAAGRFGYNLSRRSALADLGGAHIIF